MKLSALFSIKTNKAILDYANAKATGTFDSDNKEYYRVPLLSEIEVACSTDNELPTVPTEEVLVRQEDIDNDNWEPVNKEKFEELLKAGKANEYNEGFILPGFVCDFSKNRMAVLYQSETIAKWAKTNRQAESADKKSKLAAFIASKKK